MTDNVDVELFIVGDESIQHNHALSLVLGQLIPQAVVAVFLLKSGFKWTRSSDRQADYPTNKTYITIA